MNLIIAYPHVEHALLLMKLSPASAVGSSMQTLRMVLVALLVASRGGSFMIEQPGGSMMEYYEKMRWLYDVIPVLWLQEFVTQDMPRP